MAEQIKIEGARICGRNFSGTKTQYNKNGRREFTLFLDPEIGEALINTGWNVGHKPPREEGDPDRYYLNVTVSFDRKPPTVKLITPRGATVLDEDSIGILDTAVFRLVKVIINPYEWEVNGKSGIKAYLKTGYFYVEADEFEDDLESDMANIYGIGQLPD